MHVHDSLNLTLCSRSRCGAREAMTVGCKPTTSNEGLTTSAVRQQVASDKDLTTSDNGQVSAARTYNLKPTSRGPLGVLPKAKRERPRGDKHRGG